MLVNAARSGKPLYWEDVHGGSWRGAILVEGKRWASNDAVEEPVPALADGNLLRHPGGDVAAARLRAAGAAGVAAGGTVLPLVPGVGGVGNWDEEMRLRESLWPRVGLWQGRPTAAAHSNDDEAAVRMRHTSYDGSRGDFMGEFVQLQAQDGHELSAYVARPEGAAKGAVVVVQEIFGVNSQIRGMCDAFAKEGYVGIAPALFDRFERGVELKDTGADLQRAFGEFYPKLRPEVALLDVAATFAEVQKEQKAVAVVGFCFGGLLSWLAATRGEDLKMQPACTVGYYPGGVGGVAKEEPSCPVMLHFGENDSHIGKDQVEAVRAAHPEVQVFTYSGADHAFAGTERTAYNPEQAGIAWQRTLEFLRTHVA